MYKPGLIYYHDSRHYLLYRFDPPMSLHQLRKPVDDLIGTPVDTLVWGLGMGQTFLHDTRVGVRFGEKATAHDRGLVWWRAAKNLEQALAAGRDPLQIVVQRAHEKGLRILGSIRINDSGAPGDSNYSIGRLKYENSALMIGEEDPERPHVATALDFARPEVRAERLEVFEEVCGRYGADGIEIDEYIRTFFKPSEAQQNIPVLTQWMRDVRQLLDDIGKKRGEHLSLALRVHPSEEANLAVGMDVRSWIREGLLDWITPCGDVLLIDPVPAFGWMAEEAHQVGAGIYPALGRDIYDDRFRRVTLEMYRAVGTNFHAAGADGLYLADLQWPHTKTEYEIIRELADPDIYARKTKHYSFANTAAHPDPHLPERYLPQPLVEGQSARVPILVYDDLAAARADGELESVTLGLRIVQYNPEDQIRFRLNGQDLDIKDAKLSSFYGGIVPYMPTKMGMDSRINTHFWIEFTLPGDLLYQGENELEVSMEKQLEEFVNRRELFSVEIWTRYKELPIQRAGQM